MWKPKLSVVSFSGENIVDHAGWRLQKNKLMKNCRILNPEDIRVAWGGESSMRRAFDKMIDQA